MAMIATLKVSPMPSQRMNSGIRPEGRDGPVELDRAVDQRLADPAEPGETSASATPAMRPIAKPYAGALQRGEDVGAQRPVGPQVDAGLAAPSRARESRRVEPPGGRGDGPQGDRSSGPASRKPATACRGRAHGVDGDGPGLRRRPRPPQPPRRRRRQRSRPCRCRRPGRCSGRLRGGLRVCGRARARGRAGAGRSWRSTPVLGGDGLGGEALEAAVEERGDLERLHEAALRQQVGGLLLPG